MRASDIKSIIKQAAESGVQRLEITQDGRLLVEFGKATIKEEPKVDIQAPVFHVEQEEPVDEPEQKLTDDELMLLDPLAYEESYVERHNNPEE